MYGQLKQQLQNTLSEIESNGLFKRERIITTPMDAVVKVNGKDVIIFCANNYLGLSSHPKVLDAAKKNLRYAWVWNEQRSIYLWHSGYSQTT